MRAMIESISLKKSNDKYMIVLEWSDGIYQCVSFEYPYDHERMRVALERLLEMFVA